MQKASFRLTAFWLIMAIVIDVMGVGLVFPLLPSLFIGHEAVFLVGTSASAGTKELYYGLSIGLWTLGIFFGTPFLGDVSDQLGRKKVLVICLSMMGLSYLISALSLVLANLTLFMLSRLLSGFFGASFPLAQAAFIDMSAPEDKAKNISYVTLAGSLGIIFGPLLAIVALKLASGSLALKLPFLLAALLSFLNALAIFKMLQETMTYKPGVRANLLSAFKACGFMFFDERVRYLSFNFLLLQLAWGFYVEALPMILAQEYGLSPVGISVFYVVTGLSFCFSVLVVQPYALKRMPLKSMYLLGMFLMSILFLSAGIYLHLAWLVFVGLTACMFELFGYTAIIAMMSNNVTDYEQGKAMGGAGAVFGIAWTVIAPVIGYVLHMNINLPLILAAVFGLASFVLMFGYKEYVATKN